MLMPLPEMIAIAKAQYDPHLLSLPLPLSLFTFSSLLLLLLPTALPHPPSKSIVFVDGAHAIGQVLINVTQLGVDGYLTNAHKWLCSSKVCPPLLRSTPLPQHRPLSSALGLGHDLGCPGSPQPDLPGSDRVRHCDESLSAQIGLGLAGHAHLLALPLHAHRTTSPCTPSQSSTSSLEPIHKPCPWPDDFTTLLIPSGH